MFQALPTTVPALRGCRQIPARPLGDATQCLEGTATPGRSLGSTLCTSAAQPHLAFYTPKIHPEISLLGLQRLPLPSQKQMGFQAHSSSSRCPLPAPSQEQADVSLGFSPVLLGKIPAQASLLLDNPGIWHPPGGADQSTEHPSVPPGSPKPWEHSLFLPTCPIPALPNCFDLTPVTQKPKKSHLLGSQAA